MSSIKTLIDAYIKRNANQEITGPVLNGVLTAIADALGTPFIGEDGYWYEYNQETGEYVSSGTPAQGESGVNDVWAAVGASIEPQPLPSVDVIYNPTLRQLGFTFYDIQGPRGPQGTPGITGASVSVDANVGTPSVDASIVNSILTLAFHNLRGAAAGFGTPTISVGANQGTPSASVTASGPDTAKVFHFAFDGLKGETGPQGPQGPQGNPGSNQDYPFTLANNLTTDDSTVALTAAMGVQLEGEVSQLSQELYGGSTLEQKPTSTWFDDHTFSTSWGSNTDKIYFDVRNVIDAEHRIKKFKIYRLNSSGTLRVYFLKQSDYSVVTYKEVTLTSQTGVQTFDLELEDEYYNDGPLVVGIYSSFTWGSDIGSGVGTNITYDKVISTGVISNVTGRIWGYGVITESRITGDIEVIQNDITGIRNTLYETKVTPTETWLDGTFPVSGGGDAQYAFLDSRTLIPAGATLDRVRMKASQSKNLTVYLLRASDYSVLASTTKSVIVGINDITPDFSPSLFSVPTYIAVGSADSPIAMRDTYGTSETSYTDRVTVASGEVVVGRRYIIAVEVKYTAIRCAGNIPEDLDDAIAMGGNDIVLGPYDYEVKSPIVLSSGMTIRGSFGKTRLILADGCQTAITASNADGIKISDLEIVGTCPTYSVEMNGIIAGTGYDLVETEADALALNYMGTEKGIYLYYCENVVLENLRINHITGSAIRVNHTGMNYTKGLNACNLFITNCYNGIYCENEHEFSQYTNWAVTSCMIGVYVASGNLIFTAGHATRCRFAMMFVAGTNHAHGVVNGVEIKHNQVAGIFCDSVAYGEFFEGIYLSYSKLIIRDCTGLYFDDLMTGNMRIDSTGTTGKNVISKLVRRNNGVGIDNQETLTIGEMVYLY